MIAFRYHTTASLLALAVLVTVGSADSYAQRDKFGNKSGGNRNNGSHNNGSNGLKFQQNSSRQAIGNRFNNSKTGNSGNHQFGKKQSGSNFNLHGRNDHSKWNNLQINTGHNGNGHTQSHDGKSRQFDGVHNRLQHHNKHNGGQNGHDFRHTNSHGGKLMHLIQQNQKHGKVCVQQNDWCHTKPKSCHWWYQYCKPIAYCEPQHYHHCEWNYVTCDYSVSGRVVQAEARWFLGMKGLLLPGQGLGVEEIAPGSPAASVGLLPGMVITRCNGIDLVDEASLGLAIEQSGGVLQMDLLLSAEGQPATCVVVMQRVASLSY